MTREERLNKLAESAVSAQLNFKQARIIAEYAYSMGHAYSWGEVEGEFKDLVDCFKRVIQATDG